MCPCRPKFYHMKYYIMNVSLSPMQRIDIGMSMSVRLSVCTFVQAVSQRLSIESFLYTDFNILMLCNLAVLIKTLKIVIIIIILQIMMNVWIKIWLKVYPALQLKCFRAARKRWWYCIIVTNWINEVRVTEAQFTGLFFAHPS